MMIPAFHQHLPPVQHAQQPSLNGGSAQHETRPSSAQAATNGKAFEEASSLAPLNAHVTQLSTTIADFLDACAQPVRKSTQTLEVQTLEARPDPLS
jgi:hypothetical protein